MLKWFPNLEEIPSNTGEPEVLIAYEGGISYVCVNGIVFGKGVKSVEFSHQGGENAQMKIEFDVRRGTFCKCVDESTASATEDTECK